MPSMAIVTATLVTKGITSVSKSRKAADIDTNKSNSSSPIRGKAPDRSPLQFKTISMPQEGFFNSQGNSNRPVENDQHEAKVSSTQFKKNNAQDNMKHYRTDIKTAAPVEHAVV